MEKIFLIGDDINLLSSFEAKLSLKNYSVFINSVSEPVSAISLNIILNKPLFLIFFLDENSINSIEVLANLKSDLNFDIPIFAVDENLKSPMIEKLDLLNIKYHFNLEKNTEEEIIKKVLKIKENIKI
jgi:hypothetical protein